MPFGSIENAPLDLLERPEASGWAEAPRIPETEGGRAGRIIASQLDFAQPEPPVATPPS